VLEEMTILEIREKRAALIAQARSIHERDTHSAEEVAQFDALMDEADRLQQQIDALTAELNKLNQEMGRTERLETEERRLKQSADRPLIGDVSKAFDANARSAAFEKFLRGGRGVLSGAELRSLQSDSDTDGGYMKTPQQFVNELIKAVDDLTFVRGLARVFPLASADSMGAPELTGRADDADWTGEITAVTEDAGIAFGKRELTPKQLTKLVKVSRKLLRTGAMSAEAIVRDELAYKFGLTQEKGFLTGNGSGQPLGVFTASAQGISTGRDMSTDNSSTAITADNLRNNLYNLRMQYQRNASWIFHRDAIKMISKLKDGNGQYLWTPGITVGDTDRLLGRPVYMSEYAPNTFTAGLYVGIVGDFSNYWIAESAAVSIQRLDELYAANNQVGFIGRADIDGAPVVEAAFSRVKLG
jgi:HK97 family phage major capsid protein